MNPYNDLAYDLREVVRIVQQLAEATFQATDPLASARQATARAANAREKIEDCRRALHDIGKRLDSQAKGEPSETRR